MKDKKAWKRPLVILLLITLVITFVAPWITTEHIGTSSSSISLSFEGIGRGRDPKGNSFDINEIKNEAVLSAALKDAKMSETLTTQEFRKLITIKPVVGKEALNKLTYITSVTGKTEDVAEKASHPSQFVISVKDVGLPSYFSTQKLQKSLMKAYCDYLESKYLVEEVSEPTYSEKELFKLDYPELMTVLYHQADSLVRYAEGFEKSSPKFVSKNTGVSFADLKAQSQIIRDTDVRNTAAIVNYYILTKDVDSRVKYEEVRLKRANLLLSKAEGREWTTSEIMGIYNNSNNYMFASGEMTGTGFETSENEFYGELMNTFVTSKNSTIDASYDVAEIEKNIAKLSTSILSSEEYEVKVKATVEEAKSSYEQISKVKKQIKSLAKENYDLNIGSKIAVKKANYHFNMWGNFIVNLVLLVAITALISLGYKWAQKKGYRSILAIRAGVEKIGK